MFSNLLDDSTRQPSRQDSVSIFRYLDVPEFKYLFERSDASETTRF